jgi:hypothetical protein
VAGFGARCIERLLVVDHVPGFDAATARLLDHVREFDSVPESKWP